jgi:hypothetical protein
MPYPSTFMYCTVIGDCFGGKERWQFGFKMLDSGLSSQAVALGLANHIEEWWRASPVAYDTGRQFLPPNTHRLTEFKVARVGPDGKYPEGETAYSHFFLPPITTANARPATLTPQNSICVTLTTAKPRGLASKGRIFLPPSIQYTIADGDGLVPVAAAQEIRESVKILLQRLNNDEQGTNVAIFSRGKGVPTWDPERRKVTYEYPNPGAVENVTGVRVGRVVDTQRRRRRQLVESYESASL